METIFYNQEDKSQYEHKEENVFKSRKSAPAHDDLKSFGNDLFNVIKNINLPFIDQTSKKS